MKKLLVMLLCCCLALSAVAYAAELTNGSMEGTTKVSLTIKPEDNEFTVVIPPTVTIDPTTHKGTLTVTLKAGWKLPSANTLKVYLAGAKNGISSGDYGYKLKNAAGNEVKYGIRYGTAVTGDYTYLGVGTDYTYTSQTLIYVQQSNASTSDKSKELTLYVPTLPTEPGEYTDVLTFKVVLN